MKLIIVITKILVSIFVASLIFTHEAVAVDCATETLQEKKQYTLQRVNLRSCASTYCDVLVTLPAGQVVFAYRNEDGWSRVNVRTLNLTGSIYSKLLSKECVEGDEIERAELSNANITKILISRSRARYSGSCPCPYNSDRAGRRCGGRSAYSRAGGASPLCYSRDISQDMISSFKSDRKK